MKRFFPFFPIFIILVGSVPVHSHLIINTSYTPPYSTLDQTGLLDLIVKEVFRRAGISDIFIQSLPAERCLRDANNGVTDGVIARTMGIEKLYPNLVAVPEATIESRDFVAFSRKYVVETSHWKSLQPYNIGLVRGWKIFEENALFHKSIVRLDSTKSLFMLLKADRIDIALNARLDGLVICKQLNIEDVKVMEPPLATRKMYMFLHKRHEHLIPKLASILTQMKKDGTFHKIKNKIIDKCISHQGCE